MSGKELETGKRWVEQRFEKMVVLRGSLGSVAPGDRWRKLGARFKTHTHCMTYYVELRGHVKRGEIVFRDVDLEDAGAGEKAAQGKLERQVQDALGSIPALTAHRSL